jgi:hypothetical protein
MAAEWAGAIGALLGAIIGAGTTVLTAWLTWRWQNRRVATLAEKRRQVLVRMLSSERQKWRSIDALAASIGADKETTLELLIEIDARKSYTNDKSWALISRAPWPEDQQPED